MVFVIPLLAFLAESAQGVQIAAALTAVLTRFGPRIYVLLNELILVLQEDPAVMAEQQALRALGARVTASMAVAGDANRKAARELLAEIDTELRRSIPQSFMRARVGLLESLQRWKANGKAWLDGHLSALASHGGGTAASNVGHAAGHGPRIAPGLTREWKPWKGKFQRQSDSGIMIEAVAALDSHALAKAQSGAAAVKKVRDEVFKQSPGLAAKAKEKGLEIFVEVVDGQVWHVMVAPGSSPVRRQIIGPINPTTHFLAPARQILRF